MTHRDSPNEAKVTYLLRIDGIYHIFFLHLYSHIVILLRLSQSGSGCRGGRLHYIYLRAALYLAIVTTTEDIAEHLSITL